MTRDVAATGSRAAWLKAPELHEPVTRMERGEATPEDVGLLIEAAPPEQRDLMPFVVRTTRAVRLLEAARERAVDEVMALSRRALAANDGRTAVEACRLIARTGLLDETEEPRLVGCALESGWALELEVDEAILTQEVVPLPTCPRAVVALVATESIIPPPALDEAAEERIAEAIADAFCRAEGER